MKSRISIGLSSIVLIFLVLCLSIFCLLSLSDAKASLSFAERHAASVQVYYDADAAGQAFLCDYKKQYKSGKNVSECIEALTKTLPENSTLAQTDTGNIACELPMESGQTLFISISPDGEQIFSYYVYNNNEYIIDSRLPVFGGEEQN